MHAEEMQIHACRRKAIAQDPESLGPYDFGAWNKRCRSSCGWDRMPFVYIIRSLMRLMHFLPLCFTCSKFGFVVQIFPKLDTGVAFGGKGKSSR